MTIQQLEEFKAITRPVIAWLNANCRPDSTAVIGIVRATLNEPICSYSTTDYVGD